jgi:hypothetical protein
VRRALVVGLVLVACATARAAPRETHGAEQRVAYLEAALEAIRASKTVALDHAIEYVRVLDAGACVASTERLEVECLMTAARRYCHGAADAPRCHAVLDVVIAKALADKQLLPPERRYQLGKHASDPRREVERELERIHGALAVDFRLRMGDSDADGDVARHIDHYCLVSADATNLPWQACAASLVWFLRTERGP